MKLSWKLFMKLFMNMFMKLFMCAANTALLRREHSFTLKYSYYIYSFFRETHVRILMY